MRSHSLVAMIALCGLALFGCSSKPQPPAGRWQGYYEANDVMIVARLEISTTGVVRVSAPDAFLDVASMGPEDRMRFRRQMETSLAQAWPAVGPMKLDYDGKVFRKPGGVAPQIEWNAAAKQMAVMVYPGLHASIRMPLMAVADFSTTE